MTYAAPIAEQLFALTTSGQLKTISSTGTHAGVDEELAKAILTESASLASGAFAPLNRKGDVEGAQWHPDGVRLPAGFAEAYQAYRDGGWGSLGAPEEFGGQGLPFVLSSGVQEQFTSANMAFSLCMMLTLGAIEALRVHGSDDQRTLYLPKLISGEWTGTMNITEPHAGSDLSQLRCMATPQADGTYRIKGTKIFITWGEHDLADNIVHLVLARTPGAPAGTKGLSLFVVPKFLPDADGQPGIRNDLRCVSIEHKLGIHASPTCTMSFGDADGCVGWLVGEANAGMRAMFTMMNHARINVGLEGVAIAERAYQGALAYARDRVQSRAAGGAGEPVRIIEHPDVRRMLMTIRANVQACRALVYHTASCIDLAHAGDDDAARRRGQDRADLLTPVAKAFSTDMGVAMTTLAVQVFGGTGFVEETGAAQHMRDARIAPIYEGTNGIQALDLVGRKLALQGGQPLADLLAEMRDIVPDLSPSRLGMAGSVFEQAVEALEAAGTSLRAMNAVDAAAGATPYLRMFGLVVSAHLLLRQALVAIERLSLPGEDAVFLEAKIATARFYAEQVLPEAAALSNSVLAGNAPISGPDEAAW